MKENRKKRILVFHPGTIGDILACLPVYDYIRQQHPDGHIIQLCLNARQAKVAEELLLPTPYIDEVRYGEITTGSVLRRCWNLFRVALLPDDAEAYRRMAVARSPYGDGTASSKIVEILKQA